jgi:hypothetical protein
MNRFTRRGWGAQLGIPAAFRRAVAASYDLGIILLSAHYLEMCGLGPCLYTGKPSEPISFGGRTLLFCGIIPGEESTVVETSKVVPIRIPKSAPGRFGCAQVGLKGELGARVLQRLAQDLAFAQELQDSGDVLTLLEAPAGKGPSAASRHPGTSRSRALPNWGVV